jgi:hypothetical protein
MERGPHLLYIFADFSIIHIHVAVDNKAWKTRSTPLFSQRVKGSNNHLQKFKFSREISAPKPDLAWSKRERPLGQSIEDGTSICSRR